MLPYIPQLHHMLISDDLWCLVSVCALKLETGASLCISCRLQGVSLLNSGPSRFPPLSRVVPPLRGEERGLLSRTAAGNRAYRREWRPGGWRPRTRDEWQKYARIWESALSLSRPLPFSSHAFRHVTRDGCLLYFFRLDYTRLDSAKPWLNWIQLNWTSFVLLRLSWVRCSHHPNKRAVFQAVVYITYQLGRNTK